MAVFDKTVLLVEKNGKNWGGKNEKFVRNHVVRGS